VAITYAITGGREQACRLLVKMRVRHPSAVHKALLPWGDLLMMRRQLLNLQALAQRQAQRAESPLIFPVSRGWSPRQ